MPGAAPREVRLDDDRLADAAQLSSLPADVASQFLRQLDAALAQGQPAVVSCKQKEC